MANRTTYELEVRLGASTSASWKASLKKAEQGLENLNSLSNKIVAGIAAGVTVAAATATMAISSAVDTYKGFEQEMANVEAISGATESEYLALKEAAMDAGRSTVFTAQEAASALGYMSLAGWSAQESIEGLSPMLRLAAATGADLQTTSDLVTDSMSALGLGVDDLETYMDKLVTANNKANTTTEQLMEALVKAGGASKVLGVSLDDTITSLGIMANNGTKAEEAGTALNAIMVRFSGNSEAIGELSRLNVNLWDDNGKFVGWKESLIAIDEALSGLTDEQRALSLTKLAGTNRYSQFEYLLEGVREAADGSQSAWDLLESQVEESSGALGRMYDTTTDTLENAEAKLNSAKEDMQIRLVDVFSDDAKDFVNWLAEKLPEVTDTLVDFAEAHQGEFASVLESVGDGIETLWEGGISAFSWLIKNKSAVVGAIKAVAVQIAAVKVAHTGIKIAEYLTNPLTAGLAVFELGALAIGGFATAISALSGHFDDLREAAKEAYLEGSFGDMALSLSEIESVAEQIIGSSSLTGVLETLEQFGELDQYQSEIDKAVESLNKYNWKVSIGLELSEDENEAYKSAIDSYSKAAQDYALQERYAVKLGLSVAFDGSDSDIVDKVDNFYADKYDELSALGTSLNEAITEAFNDGLLDIDEVGKISEIQKQMADIQSQLASGEMDAQLALLEQDYSGAKLDADSYEKLEEELADQVAAAMETYDEGYSEDIKALSSAYNNGNGTLTKEEYDSGMAEIMQNRANQKAQTQLKALNFEINTVNESYSAAYEQAIGDAIDKYNSSNSEWVERPQQLWESIIDEIADGETGEALGDAVDELLEKMQPTIDSLYELADEDWDSLDADTQAAVSEAIKNVELLQSMANGSNLDIDVLRKDIADQIIDEADDGSNIKKFVEENYGELTSYAEPVIDEEYAKTADYMQEVYSNPFSVNSSVDITLTPQYDTSELKAMGKYYGTTYNAQKYFDVKSNAEGGIYSSPILTTFAEEGPEAAIPLDGSDRAKNLWAKAGQILGTLSGSASDSGVISGTGGGVQVSFSPTINIQGNASKDDVQSALSLSLDELRNMLSEIERENGRVSFG